jgi:3'-phosphoadenosine 5'-phosphosulfate sulfotransferase (PAPS reductase)/FAD synthetase
MNAILNAFSKELLNPTESSGLVATRERSPNLRALEAEAIHIMREVVAEARNPALLFSGGKDSIVMLRIAE